MTPRETPTTGWGKRLLQVIADMADAEQHAADLLAADHGEDAVEHRRGWVAGVRSAHRMFSEFVVDIEDDAARKSVDVLAEIRRRNLAVMLNATRSETRGPATDEVAS